MKDILSRKSWSPYISGIIIGLLQIPVFFINGSIGASGATGNLACAFMSIFHDHDPCFPALKSWWQLGFVIGIIIGAYLSKHLSQYNRPSISEVWQTLMPNYTVTKRIIYSFIGGYIFMLGARLADGCTSGNGISGIALLSVGSLVVIIAMFVTGIIITKFLYKK